jgi:Zn-dependent protease
VASDDASPPSHPPGSYRIGSIGGVDVYVRASWLVIAGLIAILLAPRVEEVEPGLGALKYVAGVAFAVLLYLSVLLHEMSHALMAKHFGLPVRSISLQFLGGMTEIEGEAATPGEEFKIAVVRSRRSRSEWRPSCSFLPHRTDSPGWPCRASPARTSSSGS